METACKVRAKTVAKSVTGKGGVSDGSNGSGCILLETKVGDAARAADGKNKLYFVAHQIYQM